MNAKFFDLKQEKQDRMINAALKVFALNGYVHASTDEIVAEAHISKGLLFHYFESKIGVYSFVFDYSIKYLSLEYSAAVDPSETSYIVIRKQMEAAKMQVMKNYPYMQYFLNTVSKETFPEALKALESSKKSFEEALGTILEHTDLEELKAKPDCDKCLTILEYSLDSLLEDMFARNEFTVEGYYNEAIRYIDLINRLL